MDTELQNTNETFTETRKIDETLDIKTLFLFVTMNLLYSITNNN